MRGRRRWGASCLLSLLLIAPAPAPAQDGAPDGQWPHHSGEPGSTRYSALDQVHRGNVGDLVVAWRRPAVAEELTERHPELRFGNNFRSTPLMVDGVLYASNGIGLVEAFEPGTGRTVWVQELPDVENPLRGITSRAVGYWREGDDARILAVQRNRLHALDARTGEPVRGFGKSGVVDLQAGLGPRAIPYYWTGAPFVLGDVVVVGQSMPDNPPDREGQPGFVRAYDVRTGELRWTFDPIPGPGEPGIETWNDRSWEYTGAANMWTLMSADPELGLVYLPLTAPTMDMYGGHRPGANLYANSLVAVDAETGERVWHFQTVHHDLWDYDLPSAPILADLTVDGRPVEAVVQLTKQGFAFVLDRATGEPVWPIEERPVPDSNTPGEEAWATQPAPTKPPPFERQGVGIDDLIDFTPQLRAEAEAIARRYVLGPLFTPPSVRGEEPESTRGTLQLPGSVGGADWNGAAFDPETGTIYIPVDGAQRRRPPGPSGARAPRPPPSRTARPRHPPPDPDPALRERRQRHPGPHAPRRRRRDLSGVRQGDRRGPLGEGAGGRHDRSGHDLRARRKTVHRRRHRRPGAHGRVRGAEPSVTGLPADRDPKPAPALRGGRVLDRRRRSP